MKGFRYLKNVATLKLDSDVCIGCGMCMNVCPHRVFRIDAKKAEIADKDACMECGACAINCPVKALSVTPGVGCASYILQTWVKKDKAACGCGGAECC
ncbi:MAG: 4Fe-4S binding protein [Deltaproteobacteria bacterium]|nr:4Fe-4S binding protein [Deltaproteobacteria bacterium]MBI2342044.1 4Fe-4S binding protein [Deltaproteobacteria bacterium]MBI2974448.1 4Fe-4S binding protein [Deltaproteobacteria bacterium]